MSRKPTTVPETNHSSKGRRGGWRLPTLRPPGPVPTDRKTDWMPVASALRLLTSVIPDERQAAGWLLRHVTSGEVPITCRLLTYRKHGAGMAVPERHEWPGDEARLGEQIGQAICHPLSGFSALHGTVDFEWLDVSGDYAVDARMSFPHVDRAALLSFFPQMETSEQDEPDVRDRSGKVANLGQLPLNATASEKRDEQFAHEAAVMVRGGMKLAAAVREVVPADPTRQTSSVEHGIRRTYAKMYDNRGLPLRD